MAASRHDRSIVDHEIVARPSGARYRIWDPPWWAIHRWAWIALSWKWLAWGRIQLSTDGGRVRTVWIHHVSQPKKLL